MKETRKMQELINLQKIKTNILGLDKLLFDGLDLSRNHTVIIIKGNETTERTLLGLQLLYGIGQSISKHDSSVVPQFISTYLGNEYMDDMLLDILIASAIQKMTKKAVSGETNSKISNGFAREIFKMDEIICADYKNNVYGQLPLKEIKFDTDRLICEEAIYYNNRTNALHYRMLEMQSDERNILYNRKYETISEYFEDKEELIVFDKQKRMSQLSTFLDFPFINAQLKYEPNIDNLSNIAFQNPESAFIAFDLRIFSEKENTIFNQLITAMSSKTKVSIFIVPDKTIIPEHLVDIIIEMKTSMNANYLLQYLSITKNRCQISALGWHQYKRRDYGIEVYPSLHTYFQQRRYLQRALVYTHSNVITDTFQQYLDKNAYNGNYNANYTDYNETRNEVANDYYQALYPQYNTDYNSVDILERILLSENSPVNRFPKGHKCHKQDAHNQIHDYHGGVTAVIGESNTYKRFLTFGGIFSSALNREHTLLLLLNKDDATIRRRLACPARAKKDSACKECRECYSYIHFMNICMGNITPEEFIYFLERQIEVSFTCGKKIQRIVIDDLQILDYCFPLLHNSPLFLSALVSVCRDREISLYLLCDKNGSIVNELKTVADNVVCTDRADNDKLEIYIERFAGYNNTPSKIYCGRINSVKELFECYKRKNEKEIDVTFYGLNSMQIEDHHTSSMNKYWISNDAKTIANSLKK